MKHKTDETGTADGGRQGKWGAGGGRAEEGGGTAWMLAEALMILKISGQ